MKVIATIGLGANLNDPAAQWNTRWPSSTACPPPDCSPLSLYASAPVGYVDQPISSTQWRRWKPPSRRRALLVALLDIEHRTAETAASQRATHARSRPAAVRQCALP